MKKLFLLLTVTILVLSCMLVSCGNHSHEDPDDTEKEKVTETLKDEETTKNEETTGADT